MRGNVGLNLTDVIVWRDEMKHRHSCARQSKGVAMLSQRCHAVEAQTTDGAKHRRALHRHWPPKSFCSEDARSVPSFVKLKDEPSGVFDDLDGSMS
jgi:hypothetical protein